MKYVFLLATLLGSDFAYGWQFATADRISLDVSRFSCNRDPMTPDIPCGEYKGRARLNFNLGLFNDLVKWENSLHGEGTQAKFTTVGWHYVLSIPTPWGIEPFMEHHSRHTMDTGQPTIAGRDRPERFPVEDSVGIRITFFERGNK
jgi:hypothetical protein